MPRTKSDAIDRQIGRVIRLHRMQRGLSQPALAEEIRISFQQLQKYENGTNRIAASQLYRVSRILDVPLDAFFAELPSKFGNPLSRRPAKDCRSK